MAAGMKKVQDVFPRDNTTHGTPARPDAWQDSVTPRKIHQTLIDDHYARRDMALARANSGNSAQVRAWEMLPLGLWHRDHGAFLLDVCGLYPGERWNTLFMPARQKDSRTLELHRCLDVHPAGLEDLANQLLKRSHDAYNISRRAIREQSVALLHKGEMNPGMVGKIEAIRTTARESVMKISWYFSIQLYGQDSFQRHNELFSPTPFTPVSG